MASIDQADLNVLRRGTTGSVVPPPRRRLFARLILPAGALLAFGAVFAYAARDTLLPATPVRVAAVVVRAGAAAASGAVVCQAAGWVEPDPFAVHVSALTDGIVKDVYVFEGQRVKAGDVIVRLVSDDARLELARAEAEVQHSHAHTQIAAATLHAAQREWENPIERQRAVVAAEAALTAAQGELARLAHEIATEAARVAELEEQLRREDRAAEASAIPEFQRTQTRLRLATQRATLETARARGPVLQASLHEKESDLKAAREQARLRLPELKSLEEAKATLREAEALTAVNEAKAALARLRLERTEVRTPVEGVVMQRLVAPGSKLMLAMDGHESSHTVRLYDPAKLQVRVDVPLADAAQVSVGQDAHIFVEVLRERSFKGKVTRIVNEADIQKNTLQIKVAIEGPSPELKPEMLARVQFFAPAKTNASEASSGALRMFVPSSALQRDAGAVSVWIVDKGRSTILRRAVTIASPNDRSAWVEITAGVQPGDHVVLDPPTTLREGQRVRSIDAAPHAPPATQEPSHASH